MQIVLSRKGFDSGSGGKPSPIFPDGRMLSIPIPDKRSPIRYSDITWQEFNLGSLVADLTKGKVPSSHKAHLDPDLRADSIPRTQGWKPLLGQTDQAQGHLRNCGIKEGDVFLFFGLFRPVIVHDGRAEWVRSSKPIHALWGWLQIGEVVQVDLRDKGKYKWAEYHPHFHWEADKNNTVYIAREQLSIPGLGNTAVPGAGVFPRLSADLQLTASPATSASLWELPPWFYPSSGRSPLTYHPTTSRWEEYEDGVLLKTAARGQEFVLNCDEYPEAIGWVIHLLRVGTGIQ